MEESNSNSDDESINITIQEYDIDNLIDNIDELTEEEKEQVIEELVNKVKEQEQKKDELVTEKQKAEYKAEQMSNKTKEKIQEVKMHTAKDVVKRFFTVRDNLDRALKQDESSEIRSGVEMTLKKFDQILETENIFVIDPEPGTEVDPTKHKVVSRIESDVESGKIAEVFSPGYRSENNIIREAKVAVSD